MKKWIGLAFGMVLGGLAGRSLAIDHAHACECEDEYWHLKLIEVEGPDSAKEFYHGSDPVWGTLFVDSFQVQNEEAISDSRYE